MPMPRKASSTPQSNGYIAPVNLADAPLEVVQRSAQWTDVEIFTLLLEYRYSPADGDRHSENMTLTVHFIGLSQNIAHFISKCNSGLQEQHLIHPKAYLKF